MFCVYFSENILIYILKINQYIVACPSSNKGLDFGGRWIHTNIIDTVKSNLKSESWMVDNHVAVSFCLMAFCAVAVSKVVPVFISYLKSHLFFNHVVNRTGHFLPHFHFYTSQPTIDLNIHSQKLSEHHHGATRGKFHTLTTFGRLRYKCSSIVIQNHLQAVYEVCVIYK